MSEKRKLRVPEVMLVSDILEKINFKHYAEYLLSKMEKTLEADVTKLEIKAAILIGDITAYVLQNQSKAKTEIYNLIASYKSVQVAYIDKMDVDEYTETLRDIFQSGVPKILTAVMNNQDFVNLNQVKKKFNDLQTTMTANNI